MALKLTTKRTKWFTVPQDPSGETKLEILHLKPGEVADIEAQSNQITGKQIGDQEMHTEIDFKFNDRSKRFVQRAVVDFTGFNDTNDKPLKCTEFNKKAIMKEFGWLNVFVEECRAELAAEVEAEEEGAAKN